MIIKTFIHPIDLPGGGGNGFGGMSAADRASLRVLVRDFSTVLIVLTTLYMVVNAIGFVMSDDASVAANYKTKIINAFFGFAGSIAIRLTLLKILGS